MINCIKELKRIGYFSSFLLGNSKRLLYKQRSLTFLTKSISQAKFFSIFQSRDLPVTYAQFQLIISRNKSKSKRKKYGYSDIEDSSDEEEEEDFDEESFYEKDGGEIKTVNVNSLRIDLLLKTFLRVSRKTIEENFYKSKIRINGNMLLKKSYNVQEGDEIDLIKKIEDHSTNTLNIGRVKILKVKLDDNKITIKAWRSKSLIIKNYDGANSWKEIEDLN